MSAVAQNPEGDPNRRNKPPAGHPEGVTRARSGDYPLRVLEVKFADDTTTTVVLDEGESIPLGRFGGKAIIGSIDWRI